MGINGSGDGDQSSGSGEVGLGAAHGGGGEAGARHQSNQIITDYHLANDELLKLVQDFLTDNVKIESSGPFAKKSQLYVASFWGIKESVQHLLEDGANPNLQNSETLWTPLHAAAFQEHGPVVMVLLEYGAQPELPDSEDRTAADFASASDKIWPFFAALDIVRTSRADLMKKGILRPGSGMELPQQFGHGIKLAEYKSGRGHGNDLSSNNYLAAMNGDVLADDDDVNTQNVRHGSQPQYSLWK